MTHVETMLRELDSPDTRSDVTWTTGNVAEAFPGVFTTLGMSFGWAPMELAFRTMFYDLGVYPASEVTIPEDVGDCFWGGVLRLGSRQYRQVRRHRQRHAGNLGQRRRTAAVRLRTSRDRQRQHGSALPSDHHEGAAVDRDDSAQA